ncbi:aminoacyl-tRNA deacylase [Corynebacterium sanguinis]|uniref:aminoacyl-tRNA deacylase n=1 Tax=Corynebacterium sanguinis TaxID=2594913 RepID=UPI0011857562|nr:aminoacyl-tRNA deacylase [Corynebacterium sanguinis]MCT1414794.1 aminoacyl-tRNA deacylase [Corynebacterium sanguinis]MCT1425171.1 aminoacyl-tRNA deacylase [Corynebacterium sanguinis]MCT1444920.1 aminoacyl-tRNA deacylase [Corynebacterium sanguinis]MCT1492907.1 aminoacyl-tRNA deacylase [Corynebacterium sanguinis]MCT1613789.1 aminoacyl-tRNA deacylase [Corynebacterium sanguinis]
MAKRTRAVEAVAAIDHEILSYAPSHDHFGEHSVAELGLDADAVLKTLVVQHERDLALCLVPVSKRLSLKAAAHALGWKNAELADPGRAQRATGYIIGGISPLGTLTALRTLIDAPCAALPTVTVSGGQRGLSISLAPSDLARLTGAEFVQLGV